MTEIEFRDDGVEPALAIPALSKLGLAALALLLTAAAVLILRRT